MQVRQHSRRTFLRGAFAASAALAAAPLPGRAAHATAKPNLLFVFADQWRAQAMGYRGDPNAYTPTFDRLAAQSVDMVNAISGCSVCCPYRASLMTGQYPLTNGVFMNDVSLDPNAISFPKVLNQAGYATGYIGKWHLDGHGRSSFIPRERRQGFEFWKALECTHNYNNSFYYGDEDVKLKWEGYDAIAQTSEAKKYIREHALGEKPFALFMSWGPPHAPYNTAPEKYQKSFAKRTLKLRPNVPKENRPAAIDELRGYYAHMAALDDCMADLLQTLSDLGIERNTLLVFTADHGDMLESHAQQKKQKPYEESICVPFLIRYPALLGDARAECDVPLNTPDIMPTVLGLCGIQSPSTVEGKDYSGVLRGEETSDTEAALLTCPAPFGQWNRVDHGGKEYRGVRTRRYTYARDIEGPWLLFDNWADPYQQDNLVNRPESSEVQAKMEKLLTALLKKTNDAFLPGDAYIKKWGYPTDAKGTVPYTN